MLLSWITIFGIIKSVLFLLTNPFKVKVLAPSWLALKLKMFPFGHVKSKELVLLLNKELSRFETFLVTKWSTCERGEVEDESTSLLFTWLSFKLLLVLEVAIWFVLFWLTVGWE